MSQLDIRRASERGVVRTSWLEAHYSFSFGPFQRADRDRFGALRVLNQDWLVPNGGFAMHPHENLDMLLIPLQSVTAHRASVTGRHRAAAHTASRNSDVALEVELSASCAGLLSEPGAKMQNSFRNGLHAAAQYTSLL
jgi:hypothetical protein